MKTKSKHSLLAIAHILLASIPTAYSAVLTLDPMMSTNFDSMTEGQTVNTLSPAWTGSGASSIFATTPASTGNSSAMAITAPGAVRLSAVGPQQTMPSSFTNATTGDSLYFSSWIIRNTGGGTIVFSSNSDVDGYSGSLVGFGITSGSLGYFTYLADSNSDGVPELVDSSVVVDRNTWYEIAFVITLDTSNYSNSLGYFYYRAAGAAEFTVLSEFNGVKMSWWNETLNTTDFSYYRIERARNNVQFDNISAGMVIPEPSGYALFGFAVVALGIRQHKKRLKVFINC